MNIILFSLILFIRTMKKFSDIYPIIVFKIFGGNFQQVPNLTPGIQIRRLLSLLSPFPTYTASLKEMILSPVKLDFMTIWLIVNVTGLPKRCLRSVLKISHFWVALSVTVVVEKARGMLVKLLLSKYKSKPSTTRYTERISLILCMIFSLYLSVSLFYYRKYSINRR